MSKFLRMLLVFGLLFSGVSFGQNFYPERIVKIEYDRGEVGTTTALAIPAVDVQNNILGWKICNDAVNTSTFLAVGVAADVSDDGIRLGLGQCYECLNCNGAQLKLLKVEGQAAANGYSVVQFRK